MKTVFKTFVILLLMVNPLKLFSQDLKDFQGIYQLQQNKDLQLQIVVQGNHLKLTQQWDFREIIFDQKDSLGFMNAPMKFPLKFIQDASGKITKVIAFEKDIWDKISDGVPQETRKLNKEEFAKLKLLLNAKADELAKLINANFTAEVSDYIAANFPASKQESAGGNFARLVMMSYRGTGGIMEKNKASVDSTTLLGTYTYPSQVLDNLLEVKLRLDSNGKIAIFSTRILADERKAHQQQPSKEQRLARLRKAIEELETKDVFSGTVRIAQGEKVLFEQAAGEMNKISGLKNTATTRFNLGSINKMFTATAIMQLIEKGKLSLDDTISNYVDSTWLSPEISNKITIHHLLSHTSGLGDFFNERFEKSPPSAFNKLAGFKSFIKTNTLAFEPGTDWAYSNSGMLLLGVIIEKVSEEDYFSYIEEHIYKPAGMVNSNSADPNQEPDQIAIGYIPQPDGTYRSNLNTGPARRSAAGGGYSTVEDLHKFALALNSGKLISDASRTAMFTDHNGYGYGFQLWNRYGEAMRGHSGGAPGINAVFYMIPKNNYTVVVLSNYDGGAHWLSEYLLNLIK